METVSRTFLKNITVFSVNDKMRVGSERVIDGGKNNSIVSVLLNEKQSELIVLIQSVAELKIVMRGKDSGSADGGEMEIDEEALGVFGLGAKKSGDTKTIATTTQIPTTDDNFTMKIQAGSEYLEYKFVGNQIVSRPDGEYPSESESEEDSSGESEDGDFDAANELEAGMEEIDSYPGEE